jgi:hypothetical protein
MPSGLYNRRMTEVPNVGQRGQWSPEELAQEHASTRAREQQDSTKTPQERLEETLRLSRFMSELTQGVPGDVPAR